MERAAAVIDVHECMVAWLTFIPVFDTINAVETLPSLCGELAERLNAAVLKTVDL